MQRLAVVTDSTADIPPALAEERGIDVVPLVVTIAGETFTDGTLSQQEFFERMEAAPQLPTTSQPSVGAFVEAYERALARAERVVSVHISSKLSGTYEAARQASEEFGERVHVFDSLNLSWGLGFQVLEAASAAAEGLPLEAALERLQSARRRVRMLVGVDSLDNLLKGGRIGKVSAFLGALFDLRVTFTVDENGEFAPVKRLRGAQAAIKHTLDWVADQVGEERAASFAVMHAMSEERAQRLREALEERYEAVEMFLVETGSVIATHTGTGWGVALLPAEK